MSTIPLVRLNSGRSIPQVGFGVFMVPPSATQEVVERALAAGYRHLDTATGYDNEHEVGAAVRASGLPREDIFVTTKLRNDHHAQGDVAGALERSARALDVGWIDLYLIHWPMPAVDRYLDTWRTFAGFVETGAVRSIGVSNFTIPHLKRLMDDTGLIPAVNQVELHPIFQQRQLRQFHVDHGIATEAWGPLGQGKYDLFGLPPVQAAAAAHEVSPAQVVLRWHIQNGTIVIPKSSSMERMLANLDLFGFELSAEEFAAVDSLEQGRRMGADPELVAE